MEPESSLLYSQVPATNYCMILPLETLPPGDLSGEVVHLWIVLSPEEASHHVFLNMGFHGEALLAPRPTLNLEDHPLSAFCDCLFNLFAATLHIGGHSSIRNLRTRPAVVTGTHLSHGQSVPNSCKYFFGMQWLSFKHHLQTY